MLCHESGIHTYSLLKDINSYQILNPETIGANQPSFVFGKHSGSHALIAFFLKKGIKITKEQSSDILQNVKRFSVERKRSVTEGELLSIYYHLA